MLCLGIFLGSAKRNTALKSLFFMASKGPPYSQGGTGKYGFESDKMLEDSTILFLIMKGEHLGTGAGDGGIKARITKKQVIFRFMKHILISCFLFKFQLITELFI